MANSFTVMFWMTIYVLSLTMMLINADREHAEHGHTHTPHSINGQHNVEFDHEAILGSQDANDEFSKLSAHEAKQRLLVLLNKMDINQDKFISKSEISEWVLSNFRKQDDAEAVQKLAEVDSNEDGGVSWAEYTIKVFGYAPDELDQYAGETDPALETFNKMVIDEKLKFHLADQDHDNKLIQDEYAAFLHPHNYDFMHKYEIERTLAEYDKNHDGLISFTEYLRESKPDREQLIVDRENFDSYDTSQDGQLDSVELRAWVLPDRRSMADEEAEHLVSETDLNRDGKLTFSEILDRHDLWVGSAATDYGQELRHDPSEL